MRGSSFPSPFGSSLSSSHVVGIDIDPDALEIAHKNLSELEISSVDLLSMDLTTRPEGMFERKFDTVIMNPPFGTKSNKGIDVLFLKAGVEVRWSFFFSCHVEILLLTHTSLSLTFTDVHQCRIFTPQEFNTGGETYFFPVISLLALRENLQWFLTFFSTS